MLTQTYFDQQRHEPQPKYLSFEEFKSIDENGLPRSNNFYLYFLEGQNSYRDPQSLFYKKKQPLIDEFKKAEPALDKQLTEIFTEAKSKNKVREAVEEYTNLLYQAYLIMREMVDNDKKLFG